MSLTPETRHPFPIHGESGIHPEHLLNHVIRPALAFLRMEGGAAENLLLGTAMQESLGGHYLRQLGGGPALGIFQMEPATHEDIWDNYIQQRSPLKEPLLALLGERPRPERMVHDLFYAAIMCRLHYRRIPEAMPQDHDLNGLARYWKRYYNTPSGRGKVEEFVAHWGLPLVPGQSA